MKGYRAFAVFCEDVREEVGGTYSLIGMLPDNIQLPAIPGAMPKLGICVRIIMPSEGQALPLTVMVKAPDGQEIIRHAIDPVFAKAAIAEAQRDGLPSAGIILRFVLSQFPVTHAGFMTVSVEDEIGVHEIGSIKFKL